MNILLTNDDGYTSEALSIMDRVLSSYGHYVMVIAPTYQQSGMSQAVKTGQEMVLTECSKDHYHLTGTPADCVIVAGRSSILSQPIDLVISGINKGSNTSSDIFYSGTCGAARQASLYGLKALALSEANFNPPFHFESEIRYVAENLDRYCRLSEPGYFVNINFPPDFNGTEAFAGVDDKDYQDWTDVLSSKGKEQTIIIRGHGNLYTKLDSRLPSDVEVVRKHQASVTVVRAAVPVAFEKMQ